MLSRTYTSPLNVLSWLMKLGSAVALVVGSVQLLWAQVTPKLSKPSL